MVRLTKTSVVLGASAFLASHALEVVEWQAFDPRLAYKPWFLNSGRAVLFTAAWLFAAATVEGAVAAVDRLDAVARGVSLAAGALIAMVVVIFWAGPGTIVPIALAFGAAIAAIAAVAGSLIGWGVHRTIRHARGAAR
jgi:hypothetical protein